MKNYHRQIPLIAATWLALTLPALADHGRPGGEGRPGGNGRPNLDRACVSSCREEFQTCNSATRTERRSCVEMCTAQIEAARAACEGTRPRDSAECAAARQLARTCVKPCRDGRREDRHTCTTALRTCASACPLPEATPKPSRTPRPSDGCLVDCRRDRHDCFEAVRQTDDTCREQCTEEASAVVLSCGRRPTEACRTAIGALATCLAPCRESSGAAIEACIAETRDCATACATATPTP